MVCSTKPLLGHHALVRVVGFRMAGFMLSGSGIRVCVLGNVELGWGGWGKVQFNDMVINKILRNQIQYRYISTQVVMLSDIDADAMVTVNSNWLALPMGLALSVTVTLSDLYLL